MNSVILGIFLGNSLAAEDMVQPLHGPLSIATDS